MNNKNRKTSNLTNPHFHYLNNQLKEIKFLLCFGLRGEIKF